MLKKNAVCLMTLACAAAFTFVSAQLPWETGYSSGGSSSSDGSSSEGGYSSSSDDPYASSDAYSSESQSSDTAVENKADKPKDEKKERAAVVGFSAQKSCPVCNSTKIKRNLFVRNHEERIHVCSAACMGRVKRNPSAFVEILVKRGEGPER